MFNESTRVRSEKSFEQSLGQETALHKNLPFYDTEVPEPREISFYNGVCASS